ncbi:UvrABC system protein C [Caldithrix abyssi DSM 13497]|uniref:UvrABC system protein C n=1 Tax=Caldithrix abyssi DSM 13497 TaxID=880073 RepID=H1XPG4_CALAY|nr:excinuclease ABC subunit UvrC [Caldithrix abyssi]APF19443.1 uvrC Excinuclease ABC subunit C [Caldithrix abyssi DSM 13497]EHO43335.1 UvrABC system protein C [Caldithrix abyssi DSM 13497]
MKLEDKLSRIPAKPGCYLFKDQSGAILYVGKANVLKNRVRSYFQKSRPFHPRLNALVKKIADIEWIVTDSEVEALILENNLIKEHKPRYNVNLRDDKTYPFIRITSEDFPQVFVTRKIVRDGSEYFGPYTDVKNVRYVLKTLRQIFPIRSCKFQLTPQVIEKKKVDLCLDYYIKKCKGPCQGLQSKEDYARMIEQVRKFLRGKTDELSKELKRQMADLAARMEFEEAALVRDRLKALEQYRNNQKIVQGDFKDRDVFAIALEDQDACTVVFKIREGKIIGKQHFYLKQVGWKNDAEVLEEFLNQYYFSNQDRPQEIFVQTALESASALESWLTRESGRRVRVVTPQRGEKHKLVQMAVKNARFLLDELQLQKMKKEQTVHFTVLALHRDLNLPKPPLIIECFDISNIQGSDAVASMVCFENGKPKKSEYRRFKINTKQTPDDFAMMREVIGRRYRRLLDEKKRLPDLIVVDGGKGQLSSAVQVLKQLGLEDQPVIGLAKRLEEVFVPGEKESRILPEKSSGLRLLQQIRDEAHRFAVTFHRKRRSKRTLHSTLDDIPGVGPTRRQKLLRVFGSVKNVAAASKHELMSKAGLPEKVAEAVKEFFEKNPL